MFVIKAAVSDPWPKTFAFRAQKTMYGGKHIAKGDAIFVFARTKAGPVSFYRQATNKIVGISDEAAAFLRGFF